VPAIGGIGGKIPGLFPWKWVKPYTRSDLGVSFCRTQKLTAEAHTLHPTPCPHEKLFAANPKYGKATVAVPPHNTSQNCSNCDQKVPKSLSTRTHVCADCGYVEDRDINAAINILKRGLMVCQSNNDG